MYKIAFDPSSGSYHFRTENGLIYLCGFRNRNRDLSPVLGIYDIEIREFYFDCYNPDEQCGIHKPFDKKVSATISHLLLQFLAAELRVVLYACDSSDGRHNVRHKLFKNWFNNLVEQKNFLRIPIAMEMNDEVSGYNASVNGGIITRKDFPHMDVLQKELIDQLPNLFGQKMGLLQPAITTIAT
jgi:hypothetical protein